MKWLRENRSFGALLTVFSTCLLGTFWLLLSSKSNWKDASAHFHETAEELTRLNRLAPYPNGENLRQMKKQVEDYAKTLTGLKEELKTQFIPLQPLAPNEFQSRLRIAVNTVAEKARANNVRLPDKFYLGFDEFASTLPHTLAAAPLGQELKQIECLLDALFEARVDALTLFRRTQLREEQFASSPPPNKKSGAVPTSGAKAIEQNVVEATFLSTPAAARKFLNQIGATTQQFFIVRLLHVRNEKDKGPVREGTSESANPVAVSSFGGPVSTEAVKSSPTGTVNFIVGNEHIQVTAKIEMVRFTF
jgi:hypothetical protein